MDKAQLIKRHNLVFLTEAGKTEILQRVNEESKYNNAALKAVEEILYSKSEIPGIIRRGEITSDKVVAVGFVHYQRVDGNRIRIGSYADKQNIKDIISVYDAINKTNLQRNLCMKIVEEIKKLSCKYNLQIGVLGSAGLELMSGLPYTDEMSDIDILVKPAPYNDLYGFYQETKALSEHINMDFELDLPNGYGVKLAEIFMKTQTVLGKSLNDVNLLNKKDILRYLDRRK